MMAHVWNEIEHDIGYKPEGEGPSEAERGLLETLGHLARAGDAAITRLLAANVARMTQQTGNFTDVHDFVARLRTVFPEADLSVNAGPAFDEALANGVSSLDEMRLSLGDAALDEAVAKKRIAEFNDYLVEEGLSDLMLNPASADLFLIGLLHARAKDIIKRTPANPTASSAARTRKLAGVFEAFRAARGNLEIRAA